MPSNRQRILEDCREIIEASKLLLSEECSAFIYEVASQLTECFSAGRKVLICGNGGSMCDAEHFTEEMTGYFESHQRKALPVISLNSPSHISCVSNDVGFDAVFSRSIEALGQPNDILIVLSTSGNSQNLLEAVKSAKIKEMRTIAFLGKGGGQLKGICDAEWIVPLRTTARIQELHMKVLHILAHAQEEVHNVKEIELAKLSIS